jgi:hypothetical protein
MFSNCSAGYPVPMRECCPPGRGCNSPHGDEPCVLALCTLEKQEPDAAVALARWEELQGVDGREPGERRFRRRSFERARDRALQALAMRLGSRLVARRSHPRAERPRVRRPSLRRRQRSQKSLSG